MGAHGGRGGWVQSFLHKWMRLSVITWCAAGWYHYFDPRMRWEKHARTSDGQNNGSKLSVRRNGITHIASLYWNYDIKWNFRWPLQRTHGLTYHEQFAKHASRLHFVRMQSNVPFSITLTTSQSFTGVATMFLPTKDFKHIKPFHADAFTGRCFYSHKLLDTEVGTTRLPEKGWDDISLIQIYFGHTLWIHLYIRLGLKTCAQGRWDT